jgi:uncharacterized protein (TIGR02246 family)
MRIENRGGHVEGHFITAPMLVVVGSLGLAEESALDLVTQLDAQYDNAWNTLDAHKLAEQFAGDAIVVPATSPAGSGTQAVIDFFGPLFRSKWSDHKLQPITAQRLGDTVVVASSRWYASLTDATGKTTRYHGDVAQTFEKINGHWKLKVASWNVLPDVKQLLYLSASDAEEPLHAGAQSLLSLPASTGIC